MMSSPAALQSKKYLSRNKEEKGNLFLSQGTTPPPPQNPSISYIKDPLLEKLSRITEAVSVSLSNYPGCKDICQSSRTKHQVTHRRCNSKGEVLPWANIGLAIKSEKVELRI